VQKTALHFNLFARSTIQIPANSETQNLDLRIGWYLYHLWREELGNTMQLSIVTQQNLTFLEKTHRYCADMPFWGVTTPQLTCFVGTFSPHKAEFQGANGPTDPLSRRRRGLQRHRFSNFSGLARAGQFALMATLSSVGTGGDDC